MARRVSSNTSTPPQRSSGGPAGNGRPASFPWFDIAGVALIAVGLILLVVQFGWDGGLSGTLAASLSQFFGHIGGFLLPIALVVGGGWLVALPNDQKQDVTALPWRRIVCAELSYLALLALLYIVIRPPDPAVQAAAGGQVGMILGGAIVALVGDIGAMLIAMLVMVIAFAITIALPLATIEQVLVDTQAKLLDLQARLSDEPRPTSAARPVEAHRATQPLITPAPASIAPAPRPAPAAAPVASTSTALAPRIVAPSAPSGPSLIERGRAFVDDVISRLRAWRPQVRIPDLPLPQVKPTATAPRQQAAAPVAAPWQRRNGQSSLPPLNLLRDAEELIQDPDDARAKADIIEETLAAFGVPATVVEVNQGPTVTQFGIRPGYLERRMADGTVKRRKIKVSRITSLADDLALALSARSIRVEAPVPGRPFVGVEVPNGDIGTVTFKGVLTSQQFRKLGAALPIALGRDVSGAPVVADLAKMPHLLIAGATGSGKSVCINVVVATLLFNLNPDELKLLMVDPKMVELVGYNGIPHLLAPVVTDVERVVGALTWAMNEMDRRYKRFSEVGVRNLQAYNNWADSKKEARLPYIVIIIDELADLMMMAPDQVERIICRLAQMARATGMHLILATQRPSVDVVTGLIKANFPARISFAVTSGIDSRVILDTNGAETLLGRGDMLYMAPESSKLQRLQGCFVSDQEINALTDFWHRHSPDRPAEGEPQQAPWDAIVAQQALESEDELLPQAIEIVREARWASTSFLQRKLRIGYSRAARIMDLLEARGLVAPADPENPAKSREVLIGREEEEDEAEDEYDTELEYDD